MVEVEPDGLEEIVGGGARVAATIGGLVLERTALRRAAQARDRAQAARAAAEGDRGRVEALGATERVPDRREQAGEAAVAVAVLRADDRLAARDGERRQWAPAGREASERRGTLAADDAQPSVVRGAGDPDAHLRRLVDGGELSPGVEARSRQFLADLEPDVERAATVAGRNQALPAVEAVRGEPGAARPGPAAGRGRGRGAERDRGR